MAEMEATRKSGRAPVERKRYGVDEHIESLKPLTKMDPKKKGRPAPPKSVWETYEKRVVAQISKCRSARFFVDSYAKDHDAGRGDKGQRIRPTGELDKYKAKYKAAKAEITSVLAEVAGLHPGVRWGGRGDAEDDDDGSVDVEEVACTICGAFESTDDNDIFMCDNAGCFRAFHAKCCDPPLEAEDLGGPDDDWFCHQCNCLENCIEAINEDWETEYGASTYALVFAEESDDDEGGDDAGGGDPGNSILTMDLGPSGSEADSDFDESGSESGSGGDSGGGSRSPGSGSDESGCSSEEDDDASECSGDDLAALGVKPRTFEDVSEANIVAGSRKRARPNYAVMNAALSDSESSDGGAFRS